ncbi:MAG: imidazole glycerol phosphate synthase subunit HisH [Thermoproteota archaeon]|jgi:imidazole glycerol-phosphate synthase subunit HisH|nr:imidazole glycerol phosphate synthase subunit HisH [Thermoproteota archaeon]MDQ3970630.1 imidazole glycerol phosphate synthase subunit HisH [Thermoproteota archaeon]MDQ4022365.1 imidazole glycerol phosphate synthase subunit HisH [Thermoproteota archaeon]
MVNVAIFDYGAGNLFSLKAALERNGAQNVIIIHDMNSLDKFDGLVLPGVGNFDPAVKSIEPYKDIFIKSIEDFMPILGICLGMEMLFNHSEEGTRDGLKILDGKVIILPKKKVKVPHMGWNNLEIIKKETKLLQGIKDGSWAYFVHSYLIVPENESIVSATSQYGVNVPAIVEEGNLYGTQFHPEKSGKLGAIIMKNFLNVCSDQK